MDLQLTRRGDYAVRAAIGLAKAGTAGEFRKLREVAQEMSIPITYTQEILTLLMRAGLAEARAGKGGGYRLVKKPHDITLLEIVEAAEGPLRLERCTLSGGSCRREETVCAVHASWEQANEAFAAALRGRRLSKIVDLDGRISSQRTRARR